MPIAEWPSSLPQVLLIDGYEESMPDTMLITEMDAGPAKRRQRYTAAPTLVSGSVILSSKSQLNDFHEFYVTELKGGTLTFLWQDRNGDDQTYAFLKPVPSVTFISPEIIKVSMRLEIRP